MKNKGTLLFAFLFVLFFWSCNEPIDNLQTKEQNKVLDKNIGEQIPLDVAVRWMLSYNRNTDMYSKRVKEFRYNVKSTQLNTILSSVPLLGLAFHHAIDDNGEHHILLLAINEQKELWSAENNRICIDANTSTIISESTAKAWTQNYKNIHAEGIWYHFFGQRVFNEIKSLTWFKEFNIKPALNDEGIPQLLVVITKNDANGKSKAETTIVYDKTDPCPPCDVSN